MKAMRAFAPVLIAALGVVVPWVGAQESGGTPPAWEIAVRGVREVHGDAEPVHRGDDLAPGGTEPSPFLLAVG